MNKIWLASNGTGVQLGLFGDGCLAVLSRSMQCGVYLYRAIATNLDEHGWNCDSDTNRRPLAHINAT